MVRVLQVYPQINNAGTERVIFNLYENIDRVLVQFDFLVERPGELDDKIRAMGGTIHYMYKEKKNDYYTELVAFFNKHPEYRVVHTHTHGRMGIVLKAAQKCGVPCRIAHSHNARNDLSKGAKFIKGLTSIPMENAATHFFACSSNAARWLFPHKIEECKVLYNGIQLESFLFNREKRMELRSELAIAKNDFVMIHVGRFAKEKNHEYLVKILEEYQKFDSSDWRILLVGEGPLEQVIKEQVKKAGLSNHVCFLGSRRDVNDLYSAADMLVFPSLHEGLGIVVIEAQASDIPCIVSDAVPAEADLKLNQITTLSLRNPPKQWAEAILGHKEDAPTRGQKNEAILNSQYNIKKIAAQMQQFYLENGK